MKEYLTLLLESGLLNYDAYSEIQDYRKWGGFILNLNRSTKTEDANVKHFLIRRQE
jgi:hypothetical protein